MFTKMMLYYFHEKALGCNSRSISGAEQGFVLYFFLRWNLASTASVPLIRRWLRLLTLIFDKEASMSRHFPRILSLRGIFFA